MEANALANLGSSTEMKGSDSSTVVQLLHSVFDVDHYCEVNSTNLVWDWRNEFVEYLRYGKIIRKLEGIPGTTNQSSSLLPRGWAVIQKVIPRTVGPVSGGLGGGLLLSPWPLMKWGMDIAGLCHRATKRIPKEIACDNGPQFIGSKVTNFLEDLKIKRITSSPYHPRANGQATSTNKVIIQNLKKKLEDDKGKWPEELPGVLWAYRTIAKSSTGETPFSLVYGAKALISMEVGEPTLRFSQTNEETNNEEFLVRRDLLDEHRDLAYVMMVAQNQRMEIYYSRRANIRYFKVGDLILRKVILNTQEVNAGSWDQHGKVLIGFQLSPKKCRTS
uniref:Integrase catalytic domain-containing protein n=1 Tax=Nicotiana tabacum TaxID=4097 RepID=A0A1S4BMA6_TOBAC|nr:PREDICTED: uncharacterized protein LOC107809844 [Nicotiana tabacum]